MRKLSTLNKSLRRNVATLRFAKSCELGRYVIVICRNRSDH